MRVHGHVSFSSTRLASALAATFLFCVVLHGMPVGNTMSLSFPRNNSIEKPHTIVKTSIVDNEFLVIFKEYLPQSQHKSLLTQILGPHRTDWEYIERFNPSRFLPSDFALIRFKAGTSASTAGSLIAPLTHDASVKHVIPQRRFTDVLSAQDDEPEGSFDAFTFDPLSVQFKGRKHSTFSKEEGFSTSTMRRLHSSLIQVPHLLKADYLWERGFTGRGVKVAIFDTGLRKDHPHFRYIRERTNWTNENTLDDGLGHGTFVAGVIASQSECLGFAPDVDIHVFRVFTNDRVSYTSWFLDAFNYAIHSNINILNLSIGGPDFMDQPFIEKVWEMSANNIVIVSAIGNDGPLYGTLNNPADQNDVIGVGGITYSDIVAPFSSRGMTTWELPNGYGRVKPDIVAYGKGVSGSRIYGGCRALSGTSVASPVVAGAVALLASTLPEDIRWNIINPASMKQALIESAGLLEEANIFEQGFGKLNLLGAQHVLQDYKPRASISPSMLDLTDCPYMWPYCTQPLYYTTMPTIVNATILNGMGVTGKVVGTPTWKQGKNGHLLELSFSFPERIWPWSGWLGIHISVGSGGKNFEGTAEGIVSVTVSSLPGPGETRERESTMEVPLRVRIIPTPPREKRILFDQFHNLRYPSGYFPRDALSSNFEPFDWNGDHIHTNLRDMYSHLRSQGYFVEVLGESFLCFNASNYGTLLMVDLEEEYFPEEIQKLRHDVEQKGLSVALFADWYNLGVMRKNKFFDENSRQWWTPATGGANVPALNDLLAPWRIQFGDRIYDGEITLGRTGKQATFGSGAALFSFPRGGIVLSATLNDQTEEILSSRVVQDNVPILGLLSTRLFNTSNKSGGRIVVFGDSSCLDNVHQRTHCFWLLDKVLQYTSQDILGDDISGGDSAVRLERTDYVSKHLVPPSRLPFSENDFKKFSRVLDTNAVYRMPRCEAREYTKYDKDKNIVTIDWEESQTLGGPMLATKLGPAVSQPDAIYIRDNIDGYIVPYFLLVGVVVFLLYVAVRGRKDRILRRDIHNV